MGTRKGILYEITMHLSTCNSSFKIRCKLRTIARTTTAHATITYTQLCAVTIACTDNCVCRQQLRGRKLAARQLRTSVLSYNRLLCNTAHFAIKFSMLGMAAQKFWYIFVQRHTYFVLNGNTIFWIDTEELRFCHVAFTLCFTCILSSILRFTCNVSCQPRL